MTRGALSPIASISAAVSLAASSGRQRMTTSTSAKARSFAVPVLALAGRQAAQRDALHVGELVADLQAGRSGFAVDENAWLS